LQNKITIEVNLPSENGFIGRKCKCCAKYFKIEECFSLPTIHCPYCEESYNADDFLTTDQSEHTKKNAVAEVEHMVKMAFQDMLRGAVGNSKNLSFTPETIHKRNISPDYQEREVDSEIQCPNCDLNFQVYGIFGYCPGCKSENILLYDANIKIIELEIESSNNPQRQLRHAYSDLVSTFESSCLNKAKKISNDKNCRFQNISDARKFFKKHLNLNILKDLSDDDKLILRRVFQKRHLYEHDQGIINDKYVRMIPEDIKKLNQKAILSLNELKKAANIIRIILLTLVENIEPKG